MSRRICRVRLDRFGRIEHRYARDRCQTRPMGIDLRTPTDEDWPAICHFDGRTFGGTYTADEIEQKRPMHDMGRFRMVVDGKQIVGVAGSYALDTTLPGARVVPMGGVTWVGVAVSHRRQGLMRRL